MPHSQKTNNEIQITFALKNSFHLSGKALKRYPLFFLGIFLTELVLQGGELFFLSQANLLPETQFLIQKTLLQSMNALLGIGLTSLCILGVTHALYTYQKGDPEQAEELLLFCKHHWLPVSIELIRFSLLHSLGILLAVFPAVYWSARYAFLPFAVIFPKDYHQGKLGSFQISKKWTNQLWKPLLPLMLLFHFVLILRLAAMPAEASILSLALSPLSFAVLLYFQVFLFDLFQQFRHLRQV